MVAHLGVDCKQILPLSMMLKVRNERIGSGGCTRGIVDQKWVHRKGVGELLDQCSQCNYNTGVKHGLS